jgi:hypothetical protein
MRLAGRRQRDSMKVVDEGRAGLVDVMATSTLLPPATWLRAGRQSPYLRVSFGLSDERFDHGVLVDRAN